MHGRPVALHSLKHFVTRHHNEISWFSCSNPSRWYPASFIWSWLKFGVELWLKHRISFRVTLMRPFLYIFLFFPSHAMPFFTLPLFFSLHCACLPCHGRYLCPVKLPFPVNSSLRTPPPAIFSFFPPLSLLRLYVPNCFSRRWFFFLRWPSLSGLGMIPDFTPATWGE